MRRPDRRHRAPAGGARRGDRAARRARRLPGRRDILRRRVRCARGDDARARAVRERCDRRRERVGDVRDVRGREDGTRGRDGVEAVAAVGERGRERAGERVLDRFKRPAIGARRGWVRGNARAIGSAQVFGVQGDRADVRVRGRRRSSGGE